MHVNIVTCLYVLSGWLCIGVISIITLTPKTGSMLMTVFTGVMSADSCVFVWKIMEWLFDVWFCFGVCARFPHQQIWAARLSYTCTHIWCPLLLSITTPSDYIVQLIFCGWLDPIERMLWAQEGMEVTIVSHVAIYFKKWFQLHVSSRWRILWFTIHSTKTSCSETSCGDQWKFIFSDL